MVCGRAVFLQILVNVALSHASELDVHYAEKLQSHLHTDTTQQHDRWNQSNHSCQVHGKHDPVTLLLRESRHFDRPESFQQECLKERVDLLEWPLGRSKFWTHTPLCNKNPDSTRFSLDEDPSETDPFCTFTSNTFLGGRGISVVTKPEIAEKIASLPAFRLKESPVLRDNRPPPYEIKHVVGKGMGVIANRTIFRGERLFANAVMGIFHNDAFLTRRSREYRLRTDLIEKAVDQLPDDSRERFHSMIGQPGARSEVVGKLNVNTFGEDFGGEEHSIIIPEPARMNHDCRPNAMYYFDPRTLVHYTQAARTIYAGEEITITYIDPLQTREKRLEAIRRSWGFDCACALCTQPPVYTEASDSRIEAINQLVEVLVGTKNRTDNRGTTDEEKPKMAELLVDLYEQERLYSHIVDAWMWVAVLYQRAGKAWEALKWTYRSEEGILIHEGPRNHGSTRMSNMIFDLNVELGLEEELDENA